MKGDVFKTTEADFRSWMRLERSLSPNTVSSYCRDCAKLFESLRGDGVESPEEATADDLAAFLARAVGEGIGKRSQARLLSSVRSLYAFLAAEGRLKGENPCDRLQSPKIIPALPGVLTYGEVEAVFAAVDLSSTYGHRDRAMLELLYSCGLRVSELVGLHISDIFFDGQFLRIIGKGNKQRLVPVNPTALKTVRLWMDARAHLPVSPKCEDMLFVNCRGEAISRVSAFNIVKENVARAGIGKPVSPHTFRHSFATHLVENGADLRVVQQMLGHESILTTEIYTHIDTRKWQETILDYHPANFGKM